MRPTIECPKKLSGLDMSLRTSEGSSTNSQRHTSRRRQLVFEGLTKYLPELEKAESYGDWIVDRGRKGTVGDTIQMPYVNYGRVVIEVEQAISFVDENPECELTRYGDILEHNGLKWDGRVMSEADGLKLDGQAVLALLLGAVRGECFCDGALLGFFEDGRCEVAAFTAARD